MERYINIVDYHQRINNSQILFDKQVRGHKCTAPTQQMVVNQNGLTYICPSPAWLPKSIGSVLDYTDFFDLLNSYEARQIRSEIDLGRYSYCNHKICNFFNNQNIKVTESSDPVPLLTDDQFTTTSLVTTLPYEICFDFDYTCNFKCPSCRTDIINNNLGPAKLANDRIVEKIKHVILDKYIETNTPLHLRWAGGEPFVSHAYSELWEYISNNGKYFSHTIQTNGSYLKKRKDILTKMFPTILELRVSFDAGTKETYEKIRLNGIWEDLLDNCEFVVQLKTKYGFKTNLQTDFVVQYDNFREIPAYINLAKQLGFTHIRLSRMWNWDTWSTDEFNKLNVTDSNHPCYTELLEILNPYTQDPMVISSLL